MILVLGPSGCGKSTLLKLLPKHADSNKLKSSSKNDITDFEELPPTLPTIGTNIVHVPVSKKSSVELREVGGSMVPIWKSYYKQATGVIFMIDVSNSYQISCASILLQNIINSPDTQTFQVLVVFNKTDVPCKTSYIEMRYLSQVDEIAKHASQIISVVEASCKDKNGLGDILKWLQMKKRGA